MICEKLRYVMLHWLPLFVLITRTSVEFKIAVSHSVVTTTVL